MSNLAPEAVLRELRRHARRARRRYRPGWVPLLAFGVLWLASLAFARAGRGGAPMAYWLAGSLLAYAITGWYLWRARRALGARVALLRFVVLGLATVLSIGLLDRLSAELGLLPIAGVALAYVALALVCWRSWPMAAVMTALLVVALLATVGPARAAAWPLTAAYGLALLGYGAVRWIRA